MLEVGVRGRSDGYKCRSGLVFGSENGRLTVFFLRLLMGFTYV